MTHRQSIALWLLVLTLIACRPGAPTRLPPPPRGALPARQTALAATPRSNPAARQTPEPAAVPSPSPTPRGVGSGATPSPVPGEGETYGFHINWLMDETITCPGSAPCDAPYLPTLNLYIRGTVHVGPSGTASGEGVIQWADVSACETLVPEVSSCRVTGATGGRFSISGGLDGDVLRMTLRLVEAPALAVTMVSQGPSGAITLPFDATYDEEIGRLLEAARLFETPIAGRPEVLSNVAVADFQASHQFGEMRTLRGYGGLFFVPPDMPLSAAWQPDA